MFGLQQCDEIDRGPIKDQAKAPAARLSGLLHFHRCAEMHGGHVRTGH
jgi:hypothetical protein